MISIGFGDGSKGFFEGVPEVFVKPGSGCMTVGADALKARVVTALIDGTPFCDGGLDAGGIGAVDNFGSAVDVAVGEEAARADLSINAETDDGYKDSGVLNPLRLGCVSFCDGGKG